MAGRHKKLGDQICFSKKCPGFLKLGRYRIKKVRGRRTARYIEHPYFRHNDKIPGVKPEHYIDNATRRLWHNDEDSYAQLDLVYETLSHKAERIHETVKAYPEIQEEEKRQWLIGYIKFMDDVILPFSNIRVLLRWKQLSVMIGQPLPEEIEHKFNQVAKWIKSGGMKEYTDVMISAHPFYHQLVYMNNNYEYKRRREIIRKRTESWKKSYNDPQPTLPNLFNPDSRYLT